MSTERPESISQPLSWFAYAVSGLLLGAAALTLFVSTGGGGLLGSPIVGASILGGAGALGLLTTFKASEARDYNEARLKAIKTAEKNGEDPVLPKDPFLDPSRQYSSFITKPARYLSGAVMLLGIAAIALSPLGLLGSATPLMTISGFGTALEVGPIMAGAALATAGATLLKMASVAEKGRNFAERQVANHAREIAEEEIEIIYSPSNEKSQSKERAESHNFDTPDHPANQPGRRSFVETYLNENPAQRQGQIQDQAISRG